MRRLCLLVLSCVLLAACRSNTPVEAEPTPSLRAWRSLSTPTAPALTPGASAADQVFVPGTTVVGTATPTPETPTPPVLLPTPTLLATPTITLTPQPTNTPLPTNTPPPGAIVTIERPLADEFVAATITAGGTIANVNGGLVWLSIRTPDGKVVGPDPSWAQMTPAGTLLQFAGQVVLESPPTPRQAVLIARYEPDDPALSVVEAGQAINLQGRYGHIDRLVVEQPKPLEQAGAAEIDVRGVATGPPAKVLVRLLDAADNVVAETEARLAWYQPGLPCDYSARLPNVPEATQLQVIALGPDDAVQEATRVRLTP